jgi:hypothetical protein
MKKPLAFGNWPLAFFSGCLRLRALLAKKCRLVKLQSNGASQQKLPQRTIAGNHNKLFGLLLHTK